MSFSMALYVGKEAPEEPNGFKLVYLESSPTILKSVVANFLALVVNSSSQVAYLEESVPEGQAMYVYPLITQEGIGLHGIVSTVLPSGGAMAVVYLSMEQVVFFRFEVNDLSMSLCKQFSQVKNKERIALEGCQELLKKAFDVLKELFEDREIVVNVGMGEG